MPERLPEDAPDSWNSGVVAILRAKSSARNFVRTYVGTSGRFDDRTNFGEPEPDFLSHYLVKQVMVIKRSLTGLTYSVSGKPKYFLTLFECWFLSKYYRCGQHLSTR